MVKKRIGIFAAMLAIALWSQAIAQPKADLGPKSSKFVSGGAGVALLSMIAVNRLERNEPGGAAQAVRDAAPQPGRTAAIALATMLALVAAYRLGRWRACENRADRREMEALAGKVQRLTAELDAAKADLIEKTLQAGAAAVATGVLHNVGNILNSISTTSSVIHESLSKSRMGGLIKANELLRANLDNLDTFLTSDPKGKKLMRYYLKIEEILIEERNELLTCARRLAENVVLVKEVVSSQQNYAKSEATREVLDLSEVVEDAINLQSGSILRHDIHLEKEFDTVPKVMVERTKLIQILMNLYKNAKEAMVDTDPNSKRLIIRIYQKDENVCLEVTDTGCGITDENLARIFTHGYSTKQNGHGFGLHSCIRYMADMSGEITASSPGANLGATFALRFPMRQEFVPYVRVVNEATEQEQDDCVK